MTTTINISFDPIDLGQILDALEIRAEAWEKTERYLQTDEAPSDFITEECSDADEAGQIAAHYRSIIAGIRSQFSPEDSTMTQSPKTDYSNLDIHKVLAGRREIAVVWCIEDVQQVRCDLNDDQAWEVLQRCYDRHDCEIGFTWLFLETIAEELFPQHDTQSLTEKGI